MTGKELQVVEQVQMVLSTQDMANQAAKIVDLQKSVMKNDVHYGKIPGCGDKPALLQPGAEKLCLVFRMAPDYIISETMNHEMSRDYEKYNKPQVCKGFYKVDVTCKLTHSVTGDFLGSGIGTANNWEPKFIMQDPYGVQETILQFARKRALVNAARTCTAASDIFTQDIEDIAANNRASKATKASKPKPPARAAKPKGNAPQADSKPLASDVAAISTTLSRLNGDVVAWLFGEVGADIDKPAAKLTNAETTKMLALMREHYSEYVDGQPYQEPAEQADTPDSVPCPECGAAMEDKRQYGGKVAFKCPNSDWNKETKTEDGCSGTVWQNEVDAHPEQYPA